MKLGGLGAVDSISRFDQVKPGANAGKTSAKASEKAASASALGAAPAPTKSSSKKAKDFSAILKDEEKNEAKVEAKLDPASTPKQVVIADPKSEAKSESESKEELVSASSVPQSPQQKNPSGSVVTISPEAKAEKSDEMKVADRSQVAAAPVEPGSIEEKIGAIAESLEETADSELSMRHLSMRDFLTKMKDEFGVEPKAVVNAFAQLDQSQMSASPEQTAGAVLAQLNLKPEQMPKAERFYREMLDQTGESALNETLVGVGAGVALKVLSEQDIAMEKLQKSIVGLNDAFARRNQSPEMSAKAATLEANGIAVGLEAIPATQMSPLQAAMEDGPEEIIDSAMPVDDEIETADAKDKEKPSAGGKFASLGAALTAATAGLSSSFAGANGQNAQSDAKSNTPSETQPKPRAFDSIESALASTNVNPTNMGGERASVPLAAGTATSAALAANLANQNGDGTTTNAQDLVRHAQMLVKAGGGEMKMQLKPEGVGDVTLKVAVKDGQVQIQMMTENDSAKKLLESNLDDLKTSLAQHKLHVDAVKIEVGGEMAKQRFEQAQQDANREQTRQMAQDFMSQFRQDRQDFRGGFSDFSNFKNYQQQDRKNPVPQPEQVATTNSVNEKSSGDRRLNLVA